MFFLQEDGPTIHELAHDDLLHNDASQDSINAVSFVTNALTPGSNASAAHSPTNPNLNIQYHVTMEDGDEVEPGMLFFAK